MPNGDPSWGEKEYPKLEKFFGKISELLEDFANCHNLMIDKYYHQSSSWSFLFKHPQGGVGKLCVEKTDENNVVINPSWWLDSYDEYTRYIKEAEGKKCCVEDPNLRQLLTEILELIVSWRKEDLSGKPDLTCKRLWHEQWTKKEFEQLNDKYPTPKLY